jgi:hypothetical protein
VRCLLWSCCEIAVLLLVVAVVVAVFFLPEVEGEVVVQVAVPVQGAELEDGFGAVQAPPGSADLHPVLDQPFRCSLDQAAGDRPSGLQERGVVQAVLLMFQVGGAFVRAGAFGCAVPVCAGTAADAGPHVAVPAGQDLGGLFLHPGPAIGVTGLEEAGCGLPEIAAQGGHSPRHHDIRGAAGPASGPVRRAVIGSWRLVAGMLRSRQCRD